MSFWWGNFYWLFLTTKETRDWAIGGWCGGLLRCSRELLRRKQIYFFVNEEIG